MGEKASNYYNSEVIKKKLVFFLKRLQITTTDH